YVANNAAGMRLVLHDADPHHVSAYADTGHLAVNGGPIRQELDALRRWLGLIAIKDMVWEKGPKGWASRHAPAGDGIVKWDEVAKGLKECGYDGVVSLHAEYETKSLDERRELAQRELALVKKHFG